MSRGVNDAKVYIGNLGRYVYQGSPGTSNRNIILATHHQQPKSKKNFHIMVNSSQFGLLDDHLDSLMLNSKMEEMLGMLVKT